MLALLGFRCCLCGQVQKKPEEAMDWSKPCCRVPDTSEASSSPLSGSLPIRAPLTLDDDDSDSEINSLEFGYVGTSSDISVGSDGDFVVGEMASESGCVERFELVWPCGSDPDECENVVGKVMVGGLVSEGVRPIAQLSWESDDVSDVVEEDTEEEGSEVEGGGELLGQIKVIVSGFVEHISAPPRVKVSEIEEGEEVESVFVKVSGDLIQVECIENCSVDSREFSETNTDELSINVLEGEEKVEYVEKESFVHESLKKLDELGTERNKNEIMKGPNVVQETVYWGNGHISDSNDDKAEDSDSVESINAYFHLSENVATGVKIKDSFENGKDLVLVAAPFQGNEAKAKVPLEERDSSIEQDQTSLGLFENCIALDIRAFEGEEEEHEGNVSSSTELSEHTELKGLEDSDLNYSVKDGDIIHAEWIEDDGVGSAETKEPNFVEEAESMAEESILLYPSREKNDVEINTDSEILDRGILSESYCGVEGSGNQIMDTNTCSQPNPNLEIINLRKCNLPEAAEGDFVLCSNFLRLITPSSSVTDKHNFVGETKVRNCEIGRIFSGEIVTHLGKDATIGLKLEDQIAIGAGLILPGSAGVGDTACVAKLELCLKQKDSPKNQNQTSLGLSLMKWGGGVLLTTNVLSQFSVGKSEIAVHVVLDNKQRGKIAIRTTNSDKLQGVGVIGILSIAVSVFRFFQSRFSVQSSR